MACVHACILSCFSCVQLFATPWTVAHQAPLAMGILQARILEWFAIPSSRRSSQPRDQTLGSNVSHIVGRFFTNWVTREAHINHIITHKYSSFFKKYKQQFCNFFFFLVVDRGDRIEWKQFWCFAWDIWEGDDSINWRRSIGGGRKSWVWGICGTFRKGIQVDSRI